MMQFVFAMMQRFVASVIHVAATLGAFVYLEHKLPLLYAVGVTLVLRDLLKVGFLEHVTPVNGSTIRAALNRGANHG